MSLSSFTKLSFSTLLVPVVLLATTNQALALEIFANQQSILFYQDGVLGDNTLAQRPERAQPTEQFNARNSRLQLTPSFGSVEVDVQNDTQRNERRATESETEAKRIRAQFPAEATNQQIDDVKKRQNLRLDEFNQRVGDELTEDALKLRRQENENPEEMMKRDEYRVRLLEDRLNREDQVEVNSRLNTEGRQELEITSQGATARLRGASFIYDPDTNTVLLTTPSGQEKELNHLPDQALERMQQLVTIENTDQAAPEFVIEENEDGDIVYKSSGVKRRRFLGLFNRNIPTEVTLNDATGEVNEYEYRSPGVLGNLIDALTF